LRRSQDKKSSPKCSAASRGRECGEGAIEHIAVAQRIDLPVVAPATANVIAKMARGVADDFLTTLYLATTAPVVVAPAMTSICGARGDAGKY